MKQLFITDLDGTLLNPESRVSERSAAIISSLSRQGVLITVATARTPATVEPLFQHTFTTPPAIVLTGAAMWDRTEHRYIEPRYFLPTEADEILELCRECGLSPFRYTIGHDNIIHSYYKGTPSIKEQKFIDERSHLGLKRIHINEPYNAAAAAGTILIFALGPADTIYKAAECLRQRGGCSVSDYPDIFNSSVAYLEIFAPGVSKADAARRLREHTGADRLTVFGDNLNDLPMMAVADVAVAVANALPQVKEAADVVIESNATDAVARYIAEHAEI